MDLAERGFPREIPPPRDRDAPIDGGRELQQHEGPPALQARDESRVQTLRLFPEKALFDGDPAGAQPADALAVGARIGVTHRDDDARDPGLADRIDAWWRPALVRAGLEVREGGRAARRLAGLAKRVDFGVRFAGRMVVTLADDLAVPHNHGTHEGIGAGPPRGAGGEA